MHTYLIKSIEAPQPRDSSTTINGLPWKEYLETAQLLLQPAMQLAAARAAAPAQQPLQVPATADRVPARQQQQQRSLGLVSFSSSWLGTPAMLAVLPAHSLTHLELRNWRQLNGAIANGPTAGLSAAVRQLSSLQQLHVVDSSGELISSCMASVPQLSKLTLLRVEGHIHASGRLLQQLVSQPLPLRQLLIGSLNLPVLNMAALTCLEKFSNSSSDDHCAALPVGCVMPQQLQQLSLGRCPTASSLQLVSGLQQLRSVSLLVQFREYEPLLQLAQLPALQHVVLQIQRASVAAGTAPAWTQLTQLQELSVRYASDAPKRQQWTAVSAAVAACNRLTKLVLESSMAADVKPGDEPTDFEENVAICARLAGLTRLRDLCFPEGSQLVPRDALALTALSNLTRLVVDGPNRGVCGLVATALACNLRQLQHLEFNQCYLGSMSCLAAIAQLTQLTELSLEGSKGLTEPGLMLLTGLKQLQSLAVSTNESVTAEVLNQFWAAARR
jgi:hypothetical protein